tara:strand:+ start:227 stop:472 length:246 start_codon:yes stop_codon:yes gene_type:complete
MTKITKIKAQIKSNAYYIFWGACTFAVMSGQIYVGNGYRRMAETNDTISADINLLIEILSMPSSKFEYDYNEFDYNMPILQ